MSENPLAAVDLPEDLVRRLTAIPGDAPLLLCSDFDGTLSLIVERPQDAVLMPGIDQLVRQLAASPLTTVAVVSGRSVADLRSLTGLDQPVILIGSHGAEFESGFASPVTDDERALYERLDDALSAIAADVPGVVLERKPISIATHVRRADRDDANSVLTAVREGPATWPGVHATAGKEVLELAVQHVDKGSAVEYVRDQVGAREVVFVGDDVTDERAFERLSGDEVTVKVGDGETAARYRVSSVEAVRALLALLTSLR